MHVLHTSKQQPLPTLLRAAYYLLSTPPIRDFAPARPPPGGPPPTAPSDTYESIRFVVGGRECYALSWLLEASSPVIANRILAAALAADPGTRFQSVTVPPVPGLDPGRQHALFGMAVEWLYTGGSVEPPAEALIDLWAMAAVLQVKCSETCLRRLVFAGFLVAGFLLEFLLGFLYAILLLLLLCCTCCHMLKDCRLMILPIVCLSLTCQSCADSCAAAVCGGALGSKRGPGQPQRGMQGA